MIWLIRMMTRNPDHPGVKNALSTEQMDHFQTRSELYLLKQRRK